MRSKPYTVGGIGRVKCSHCHVRPASAQWSLKACAAKGRKAWWPLCEACDIELNAIVLRYVDHPLAESLLTAYRERLAA